MKKQFLFKLIFSQAKGIIKVQHACPITRKEPRHE